MQNTTNTKNTPSDLLEMAPLQLLSFAHEKLDNLLGMHDTNMPQILACLLSINTLLQASTERLSAEVLTLAHPLYSRLCRVLNAHETIDITTPMHLIIKNLYGVSGQSIYYKLLSIYKDQYSIQFFKELVTSIEHNKLKTINNLCVEVAE